jgi:hypothetical protein
VGHSVESGATLPMGHRGESGPALRDSPPILISRYSYRVILLTDVQNQTKPGEKEAVSFKEAVRLKVCIYTYFNILIIPETDGLPG